MAEYIEREALLNRLAAVAEERRWDNQSWQVLLAFKNFINNAPAADVVEVEAVAQMFCDAFGDPCACNYNDNDEWLSAVCDYDFDECPDPKDPLGCWKQYIKHYGERRNDATD